LLATASQLNRSAVESVEFDHSMIAGGLSKIQTADNVFGIFSTPTMRERCMVQLQFMKTRSSGAVGQKIDLSFNPDTLRISDMEGDTASSTTRASDVYEKLKSRSTMGTSVPTTWEKPTGGTHAWDVPTTKSATGGETIPAKTPPITQGATTASREFLRGIVSREE